MWKIDTMSVTELLDHVEHARLALPRFQRQAVWTKGDWVPFISSVLLDRPTGTLLVLKVGADAKGFSPKHIEGARELGDQKNLEWLLLDGQQRLTTLYRLKHGFPPAKSAARDAGKKTPRGDKHAVINVKRVLDSNGFDDTAIEFTTTSKNYVDMAKKGKIAVSTLLDEAQLPNWLQAYALKHEGDDEHAVERVVKALNSHLPGLMGWRDYKFPVLVINETAPLDVVVDIFEGMNRRGVQLNQFDLMVARLYQPLPDGTYFDLRQEWEDLLDASRPLRRVGVKEGDGMLPLQLIAMQVARLSHGAKPAGVQGLNNKDVLELPAEQIIGHAQQPGTIKNLSLRTAVRALEQAADFLIQHCGVVCPQLMPQQSMLLPLADQFLRKKSERLQPGQLKRWFFSAGLSIDYYGSVNSFASRDCKELTAWAEAQGADTHIPTVIAKFTRSAAEALDFQQPFSREGNILGKAVMALLVASGACDWKKGQIALAAQEPAVEFHHVVPEKTLARLQIRKEDRRPIAGLTPISAPVNAAIRDQDPKQVLSGLGADADRTVKGHQFDRSLLEKAVKSQAAWSRMLDDRETKLREFVVKALAL